MTARYAGRIHSPESAMKVACCPALNVHADKRGFDVVVLMVPGYFAFIFGCAIGGDIGGTIAVVGGALMLVSAVA